MHVLLVEDDLDHAALVERSLAREGRGIRVVPVSDGEQALAYLLRQGPWADPVASPRPDLVILDLRLPRLDGFRVLQTVKESAGLRPIPVVVLTTSEAGADVEHAYALRANGYVVKPVDFSRMVELLDAVAGFWLDWNRGAGESGPDRP